MRRSTEMLFGFACIGVFFAAVSYLIKNVEEEHLIPLKRTELTLTNVVLSQHISKNIKAELEQDIAENEPEESEQEIG